MTTIDWKWALPAAVGVLSFVVGGGVVWRFAARVKGLIAVDDMSTHYWSRPEQEAFQREYNQWKDRVHEDFLQPFRQQTAALFQQSVAIAEHGKTLQYVCASQDQTNVAIGKINEQLAELVEHSMQRRASDPPP